MEKALVIGHSFVRRLQNVDFNLKQVFNSIKLSYKSRATLRDIKVSGSYPVVVIVIGSNDLCNKDIHPVLLATDIIAAAQDICIGNDPSSLPAVVITQILHRGAAYIPPRNRRELRQYNAAVDRCNTAIQQFIDQHQLFGVHFYRTKDFDDIDRYLVDGVHLNPSGNPIFTRYIRGALLFGHNSLNGTQTRTKRKKHRAGGRNNRK